MAFMQTISALAVTILASLVLILLGAVYFMLTIWIIKSGAGWAGYETIEGSTVVLTAGIISSAAIIGSALQR